MNPFTSTLLLSSGLLSAVFGSSAFASASAEDLAVKAFVRTIHIHGVPYREAARFSSNAVPVLAQMLSDPEDREYWANIITTLGIIGSDAATKPLVEFLEERFQGEVDLQTLGALLEVLPALGHAARRGNREALQHLLDRADPELWNGKSFQWSFRAYRGGRLKTLLQQMLIGGLGLSGNESAKKVLLKMRDDPNPDYRVIRIHSSANIREALVRLERLSTEGPDAVFRPVHPDSPLTKQPAKVQTGATPGRTAAPTELRDEALREYERIKADFLSGRIEALTDHLADNGKPLLPPERQSGSGRAELVAKLKNLSSDMEKTKALLQALDQAVVSHGPAMVQTNGETVVVRIELRQSREIRRGHIRDGSPTQTVDSKGDLLIYMIRQGGIWYWNPFGW